MKVIALHSDSKLINIAVNPVQSGQTLAEEIQEAGEWLDSEGKKLNVDYNAMQLPHKNVRVYGVQQFERLLAEFKTVIELQTMEAASMDDFVSSSGTNKLNNNGHAWTVRNIVWSYTALSNRTQLGMRDSTSDCSQIVPSSSRPIVCS